MENKMLSVRESLISNISDDHKEALGFRPRYNYTGMNLIELKRLADETRRYADKIIEEEWEYQQEADCDYYAEWDRYAEDIKERQEQEKWGHIDDIYSQNNWN